MKYISLCLFCACLSLSSAADASDKFPVLDKFDQPARAKIADLLSWQQQFEGLSETELIAKLGKPDQTQTLPPNAHTNKPMHNLVYAVAPLSDISFTIHENEVAAVALVLVPQLTVMDMLRRKFK